MKVVGIDFSSNAIDFVSIDDDNGQVEWSRYNLYGNDAFDRTRKVGAVLPKRGSTFWDDVIAVGIEHPAGPPVTVLAPMRVQGAVLSMLPSATLVRPWPPSAWRKAVGLKGNSSKKDVWKFVSTEFRVGYWGYRGSYFYQSATAFLWPQDAADAYCIALATRGAISQQENAA
jgi:hypothetical protein